MPQVVLGVGILIFKDDRVLLVRHTEKAQHLTGVYGIPAGRYEKGEDSLAAAVRELKEETGLVASKEDLKEFSDNEYSAWLNRKGGKRIFSTMKIFISRQYSGVLEDGFETVPEWIKISELSKYPLLPNMEKAIHDGLKYFTKK